MKDDLLLTEEERFDALKGIMNEGWFELEDGAYEIITKTQLVKAKSIIEKQERERIIEWLRKRWIGYDIDEAPEWVYLRFGGTQKDWEDFIGKP